MTDTKTAVDKERLYLFAPAAAILLLVTFQRAVPPERLQSAIRRAAARQAVLGSRVQQQPDGSAFFTPCNPPLLSVQLPGTEETPEALMRREMQTPFAVERGEWMRHYCWQPEGGRTVWLLSCHHMAGDGIAMLYFLRDVQKALFNPSLCWQREPFYLCVPGELQGALPVPMRWGMAALNRQWKKTGHGFTPEDREKLLPAYWAKRNLSMAQKMVEPEQLTQWLAACRLHHTTLTAAWLAAVLLVTGEAMDAGIAVSIRPAGLESMANWATGISIRCTPDHRAFWETARDIRRRMLRKSENPAKRKFLLHFLHALSPTLIDAAYFAAFDGFNNKAAGRLCRMFGYDGHPKSCSVTNLLRAPLADGAIETIAFYPPMVPNAKRLFGLVTAGDRLCATLQILGDEADAPQLLNAVITRMVQACES